MSDMALDSAGNIHVLGLNAGSLPEVDPLLPPDDITAGTTNASAFLVKIAPDGGRLLQSSILRDSQYLPSNAKLLVRPDDSICLLGTGSSDLRQSPGGLTPATNGGAAISCVQRGSFSFRTFLPETGGAYTDVTSAPDGSLLFAGVATQVMETSTGAPQPLFGGAYYSDRWYLESIGFGDAFLMRVSTNNPEPKVHLITPDTQMLSTGAERSTSFEVVGTGFAYGARVELNGQPLPATLFHSRNRITTGSIDQQLLRPGPNSITVSLPGPGGGASEPKVITGLQAPPLNISVSPSAALEGSGEIKLTVRADNLTSGSVLRWNGEPRPANLVPDAVLAGVAHFELLLSSSETAQAGTAEITVTNPGPGGGVSAAARFIVQPRAGFVTPVLLPSRLQLSFGGPQPSNAKVAIVGSGFTTETKALWNGREVPVEYVSGAQIRIEPPAADLMRLGVHQLYVSNTGRVSNIISVSVTRGGTFLASAADTTRNRLYVLERIGFGASVDLVVLDLSSGEVLNRVAGIGEQPSHIAAGDGGQFVYVAGSQGKAWLRRYNTSTQQVDLEIPVQEGERMLGLLAAPGSPQSVIASIATPDSSYVAVFDGTIRRGPTSMERGVQNRDAALFATRDRIFLRTSVPECWSWLEYDGSGIRGAHQQCGTAPPEFVSDRGVRYLMDGERTLAIAVPVRVPGPQFPALPAFAVDMRRNRAFHFQPDGILTWYDMENMRTGVAGQFTVSFGSGNFSGLYVANNGDVVLVTQNVVALVPESLQR
jgi:hypothetical protein